MKTTLFRRAGNAVWTGSAAMRVRRITLTTLSFVMAASALHGHRGHHHYRGVSYRLPKVLGDTSMATLQRRPSSTDQPRWPSIARAISSYVADKSEQRQSGCSRPGWKLRVHLRLCLKQPARQQAHHPASGRGASTAADNVYVLNQGSSINGTLLKFDAYGRLSSPTSPAGCAGANGNGLG